MHVDGQMSAHQSGPGRGERGPGDTVETVQESGVKGGKRTDEGLMTTSTDFYLDW